MYDARHFGAVISGVAPVALVRRSVTIVVEFAARSLRLSNYTTQFGRAESYGQHSTRGIIPAEGGSEAAEGTMLKSLTLHDRPAAKERVDRLKKELRRDVAVLAEKRRTGLLPELPSIAAKNTRLSNADVSAPIHDTSTFTAAPIDREVIAEKLGTRIAGTRYKSGR